jgi:hypothetical protein
MERAAGVLILGVGFYFLCSSPVSFF